MVTITPVQNKKDQKDFIKLLWTIYKDDKYWVPPLLIDANYWFSKKHPFYEYGEMQCFLAKINGETVGRIAAIHNPLYNKYQDAKPTGFFGFFECIDNQAVANSLFDTAQTWLKNRGLEIIHGPASPSSNYDYGLLIKGFEDSPRLMMTYNPSYYENLILDYGFNETKRLFAYKIDVNKAVENERLKRGAEIVKSRSQIQLRTLKKKNLEDEMAIIKSIYNAAWEANYGHIPFTNKEIDQLGKDLKLIASEDLLLFAMVDGKVIAKGMAIPDLYQIQKGMNGKLFPFNFIKIFTQRKKIKWVRVLTLGIIPEYRNKGIDVLLCYELLKNALKKGIQLGEGSWILEDNVMMNRAMKNFYGEIYKEYMIYEKNINN